jgi:uncharacterized protein YdhG (YjbR/CyaY superfamily)
MRTAKNVDDYLSQFPEPQRSKLAKIRKAIKEAAPKAEDMISYGMPAYKQNGVLVYFGGFQNHCSFFPASYSVIQQFAEELKNYKTSKGTVQLPLDKPVPSSLIKQMVQARIKENEAKLKAKAAKKKAAKSIQTIK